MINHEYTRGCIHKRFEFYALGDLSRCAIQSGALRLTYADINGRANQLGRHLLGLGAAPGQQIGICLDRSEKFIIAVMAILKIGCSYVPLDPFVKPSEQWTMSAPSERRDLILRSARIKLAIVDADFTNVLPADIAHVAFDALSSGAYSRDNIPIGTAATDLAYVMFTSGSTGTPKGVEIAHRSVTNLLDAFESLSELSSDARCTLWTRTTFDVSVYEMFSALCFGRTLFIPSEHTRVSPAEFVEYLIEESISSAYLPSQVIDYLFINPDFARQLQLSRILVGVEPIEEKKLLSLASILPTSNVINGYGPTEATVCATLYKVDRGINGSRYCSIGVPVANCQVYILNTNMSRAKVDEVGEIFIGGAGLARGYVNDPQLTASSFIPDPFSAAEFGRLYKTGDAGLYRADGNLEFVGRLDRQIKLRGFRIEPAEIEACLNGYHSIARSLVIDRRSESGDVYLNAYIILNDDSNLDEVSLRAYLHEHIPHYMVPPTITIIDSVPLTVDGKVDIATLRSGNVGASAKSPSIYSATNATENALLEIWSNVLGLTELSVNDNFFESGGYSMLAVAAIIRIKESFAINLPVRAIFDNQTVSSLSAEIIRIIHETVATLTDEEAANLLDEHGAVGRSQYGI